MQIESEKIAIRCGKITIQIVRNEKIATRKRKIVIENN